MISGISLLYVGAVLTVVGVMILGKADPRGTAVLGFLTGTLGFIINLAVAIITYAQKDQLGTAEGAPLAGPGLRDDGDPGRW